MRRLHAVLFGLLLVSSIVFLPADTEAYARCNCTAYAHSKRRDLPLNLGNANTWAARAKAQGFPVDGQPQVGDILVLAPGVQGAHRSYGHVAYVIGVSGNSVTVTEMNGGASCKVIKDTFRIGRGVSFIHPKG